MDETLDNWGTGTTVEDDTSSDERGTPKELLRKLLSALDGKFDTDPASGAEPFPIADTRFNKDDNGLTKRWGPHTYLNPPFSDVDPWAEKARDELKRGDTEFILFLLGSLSLSADWFHDYVVPVMDCLCVLDDRPSFTNTDGDSNQPILLAGLGDTPTGMVDVFHDLGAVYEPLPDKRTNGLRAFTDGRGNVIDALHESDHWKQQFPDEGYGSDTTWYLNNSRSKMAAQPHSDSLPVHSDD